MKAGLDRDVRLGVLEQVPLGTPDTWCHRMVICTKKNGSLRRTIDLQQLNRRATRETTVSPHSIRPGPFQATQRRPSSTPGMATTRSPSRTRIDTTQRLSPRGAGTDTGPPPQGYIASGDAYTARYDTLVATLLRKTKCIDDALLWAPTIEEAFHQATEWLDVCAHNGITLNPSKFCFAQDEVEFAGFEITRSEVKPNRKYLCAIKDFPTPKGITDVRAWFGLVNQVAYAFSMASVMSPFRALLKTSSLFKWTNDLQQSFDASKTEICDRIKEGVQIFEKRTGSGTGYSRSTYAPVEGEALAVADALDKARHFVLGCSDLIVAVDHKPLLKLFGDRSLEDIPNTRLQNLKEKTHSEWYTSPVPRTTPATPSPATQPGLPRRPVHRWHPTRLGVTPGCHRRRHNPPTAATTIENGPPDARHHLPPSIRDWFPIDGVICRGERIVMPTELRPACLSALHAAHQGISGMTARAVTSLFWPGITRDIADTRNRCATCNGNAPSQPAMPSTTPVEPEYPFQHLCLLPPRRSHLPCAGGPVFELADRIALHGRRIWPHAVTQRHLLYVWDTGHPHIGWRPGVCLPCHKGVPENLGSPPPHLLGLPPPRQLLAVKTMKRLIAGNTDQGGTLSDQFHKALLQYRNGPDPATKVSPATCLFGRATRDLLPGIPDRYKPHTEWADKMDLRERALSKRTISGRARWDEHTQGLSPLKCGDTVLVQNQSGRHPTK